MEHTSMASDTVRPPGDAAHTLVQWCCSALALPNAMNVLERSGTNVDRNARPTILRLWAQAAEIQKQLDYRCPAPPERPGRPEELGRAVAALRDWATFVTEAPTPEAGGQESSTIVSLGDLAYQVGTRRPVTLTENEDNVLQAMLLAPNHTLDKPALLSTSGVNGAPRVLKRLREKYGGIFGPAIRCPKKKGEGGYHADIRDAADDDAQDANGPGDAPPR
jgi:hypothetical protein